MVKPLQQVHLVFLTGLVLAAFLLPEVVRGRKIREGERSDYYEDRLSVKDMQELIKYAEEHNIIEGLEGALDGQDDKALLEAVRFLQDHAYSQYEAWLGGWSPPTQDTNALLQQLIAGVRKENPTFNNDGTLNVECDGVTSPAFDLTVGTDLTGATVDSTGGTQIYQLTPTIPAGTTVSCEFTTCPPQSGTISGAGIALYLDGFPWSNNDTLAADAAFRNGTSACPLVVATTLGTGGTVYVMAYSIEYPISGGTVTCTTNPVLGSCPVPNCTPACFSEAATVQVKGKGQVLMKDLKVNDQVLVGRMGHQVYQSVYAFGHWDKMTPKEYLQIYYTGTSSTSRHSKPLELSGTHLLYVKGKASPVRADTIKKGDILIQKIPDKPSSLVSVTKVEKIIRKGAYMPLTKDGSIVVDNILASTYVSIMDEAPQVVTEYLNVFTEDQLVHWWLAPYRLFCQASPNLCSNGYNEEGIAHWLFLGRYVARVGNTCGRMSRGIGLVVFGLLMAICMIVDVLVGHLGTIPGAIAVLVVLSLIKSLLQPSRRVQKKVD